MSRIRRTLKSGEDSVVEAIHKRTRREKETPWSDGAFLTEEDADGNYTTTLELTHNVDKVLRHPLGREPRGFIVCDITFNEFNAYPGRTHLTRHANPNGEPLDEFITLYPHFSTSNTLKFKIWVW